MFAICKCSMYGPCPRKPEEGVQAPGTGVTGSGESPHRPVSARNGTQILCQSRRCS